MKFRPIRATILLAGIGAVALTAAVLQVAAGNDATVCTATGSGGAQVRLVDKSALSGSADASTLIQQAIDATSVSGGGVVQLPAGRFDLDHPLVMKNNVALKGEGQDTVLKASSRFMDSKGPYGGHPLVTTDGAVNVTIAQLTADQSGDVLNGNVRGRLNEYLIDVRRSTNAVVDGVTTKNPFTYSIAVVGSSNFCIRNSTTVATTSGKYDQLDGIHVTDSDSGVVLGNHVDQRQGADGDDGLVAQSIGAPVHDVVYRDNEVRGGSHGAGMQIAVSAHEVYNITIVNNRFWGSPSGVHTGYYDGGNAAVHDVVVRGNIFVDNDGASIDFYGRLKNVTVTDNSVCRSGVVGVTQGDGNNVTRNLESC